MTVSGVSPARSSASDETDLNVDPGAYCPYVAMFRPPVPGPLAAARISPVDGRIATSADAGPTFASACSAATCIRSSIVSCSGCPSTASTRNSSRVLPSEPDRVDGLAGRAAQLLVVPLLEPGQPATSPTWKSGFSSIISAVTSPTEPRIGAANPLVGASGSSAAMTAPPLIRRTPDSTPRRHLVLAVDDGLDEGERPEASTRSAYAAASTSTSRARSRAEATALAGADLGAVDADADHRPVGDQGEPAGAEDVAALGAERDQVEGDRLAQRGLDGGDVPLGQPLVVDLRERGLAGVGPAVGADRPGPVEGGRGGRASPHRRRLADVGDGDRRLEVLEALDGGGVLLADGLRVGVGEPDRGEVPAGQGVGERAWAAASGRRRCRRSPGRSPRVVPGAARPGGDQRDDGRQAAESRRTRMPTVYQTRPL